MSSLIPCLYLHLCCSSSLRETRLSTGNQPLEKLKKVEPWKSLMNFCCRMTFWSHFARLCRCSFDIVMHGTIHQLPVNVGQRQSTLIPSGWDKGCVSVEIKRQYTKWQYIGALYVTKRETTVYNRFYPTIHGISEKIVQSHVPCTVSKICYQIGDKK
ncbi:hypothetical protein Dimus_012269 [Dionaea muscipula]